jgi:hypothetical protein
MLDGMLVELSAGMKSCTTGGAVVKVLFRGIGVPATKSVELLLASWPSGVRLSAVELVKTGAGALSKPVAVGP